MSVTGTLNQSRPPTIVASFATLAGLSHQRCASITAAVNAIAAFGYCATQSPRMAKDFSGWFIHIWPVDTAVRSEEHTSELQSLMRISYAVFCLKKKKH